MAEVDARPQSVVAIGKFDEMKNTNKIICQNISKELYINSKQPLADADPKIDAVQWRNES